VSTTNLDPQNSITSQTPGEAPLHEASTSFKETIKRDIRHFMHGPFYSIPVTTSPVRTLIILYFSPEFRLVLRYRIYNWVHNRGMQKLAFLMFLRAKRIHGCDIAPDATIGPGLRLGHCQDIVIGAAAKLGTDCVVFNGVTMGNRELFQSENHMPQLGDRVLVGTGAKLVGGVVIGDDARIGANAVVLKDVPAGATAVGNPARIIPPKPTPDGSEARL